MNKLKFLLVPLLAASFLASCSPTKKWYEYNDWWNYCSSGKKGEQATLADIGKEVDLTVNEQIHKVRLIGIDHDDLADKTGKAHCTFEFANLLSDFNGYSLATLWNTSNGVSSTNFDYLNSDLRKALDGIGNGTLRWYQIGSETKSEIYNMPVINMLPKELKGNIKTVKKSIATTSTYSVTNYEARVFVLTHNEITADIKPYARKEGEIYQYYIKDTNSSRIKYQVRWHDGATTSFKRITDFTNFIAYSYAGFNDPTDIFGGYYWLASPSVDDNHINYICYVCDYGFLDVKGTVYNFAPAVAPAFCI